MRDGSAALSRVEVVVGRRRYPRHRLDLSARLVTADANVRVQLENISDGGACIRLSSPLAIDGARLCWLNFEVFGRLAWTQDLRRGLEFDDPLTNECMAQTIEFGELMTKDRGGRFLRLASAWVHGPGDW